MCYSNRQERRGSGLAAQRSTARVPAKSKGTQALRVVQQRSAARNVVCMLQLFLTI